MAYELRTEIDIAAPIERVWSLLSDFASYPSWNPFMTSVDGALALGAGLVIHLRTPNGRTMRFKPTVTRVDPGTRFAWRGSLPIPGLFSGEHRFELSTLPSGQVRLVHSEQFDGLLVPLGKSTLNGPIRKGFEAMNQALKARAEAAS